MLKYTSHFAMAFPNLTVNQITNFAEEFTFFNDSDSSVRSTLLNSKRKYTPNQTSEVERGTEADKFTMSSLQFLQKSVESKMLATASEDRGEITPNFRNNTNFPDGFDLSLLHRKSAKKTKNSSTVCNVTTKTCSTGAVEEVGNSSGSGQPVEKPRDKGEPPRQVVVLLLWLLKIENLREVHLTYFDIVGVLRLGRDPSKVF